MKQETQPFSDIKAVTFDVGNTLITTWPSVGQVYADIAARHGHGHLTPSGFKALQIRRSASAPEPDHLQSMLELLERL